MASCIVSLRSNDLDKNLFFYFHPSEHDCSGLKGACQRRADTRQSVCLMVLFNVSLMMLLDIQLMLLDDGWTFSC